MWFRDDEVYYCPICGLPLSSRVIDFDFPDVADQELEMEPKSSWLDDLRLLCDPDDEVGQLESSFAYNQFGDEPEPPAQGCARCPHSQPSEIEEFRGKWRESPICDRIDPDGSCHLVNLDRALVLGYGSGGYTFDGRSYIAVHSACLDLARAVFASSPPHAHLKDMRGLWTALRWRHAVAMRCRSWRPAANFTLAQNWFYAPSWEWWGWEDTDEDATWPGPSKNMGVNLIHVRYSL